MKQLFFILSILSIMSCKAQQVLPLNNLPSNSLTNSYFKDLNNELDPYSGTWIAFYQGRTIKLIINKEIKIPFEQWDKSFYRDRLVVRYEIKDISGSVLQSTLNKDFTNYRSLIIRSLRTLENNSVVQLLFSGGNCSVGIGEIKFQKISATQFSWSYYPGTTTRNDINCPPGLDYKIYLPETENLVFTKQ
jgi:hypothetical protein